MSRIDFLFPSSTKTTKNELAFEDDTSRILTGRNGYDFDIQMKIIKLLVKRVNEVEEKVEKGRKSSGSDGNMKFWLENQIDKIG